MPSSETRADNVVQAVRDLRPSLVGYVPSNSIADIITGLEQADASERGPRQRARVFPLSREEEAIGLLGALPLAGQFGVIVMQDNGFGNSLTALTTFSLAYHLPLLIVANTRGGLGEYNSMIHSFSASVPALLREARIPTFTLDRRNSAADWGATVRAAGKHATMTRQPVVVLMEFFHHEAERARA